MTPLTVDARTSALTFGGSCRVASLLTVESLPPDAGGHLHREVHRRVVTVFVVDVRAGAAGRALGVAVEHADGDAVPVGDAFDSHVGGVAMAPAFFTPVTAMLPSRAADAVIEPLTPTTSIRWPGASWPVH